MNWISKTILGLFILSVSALPLRAGQESAEITADSIIYDRGKEWIYAEGNVEVEYQDMTFKASKIEFDREGQVLTAWGNVHFKQDNYQLESESMVYNLLLNTGTVSGARIISEPLIVYADSIVLKGKDEFFIPRGDITTCDHNPPHYNFTGKDISLKLESRLSAWKTVLFIRKLPTVYYPYFTKKLGPRRLEWSFDLGNSNSSGYYFKTKVSYLFTDNLKVYTGLDLMTKKGVGFKGGYNYRVDEGRSDFEIYYVEEKDTDLTRGTFKLSGWQRLNPNLALNYRSEFNSHRLFGYEYDRDGREYMRDNLYYQFSADLNKTAYQASAYFDRKEVWDEDAYRISRYVLPGVSLNLFPVNLPGRIIFSGDSSFKRSYNPTEDYWNSAIIWKGLFRGSYRLNPSRNYYATLTPGLGYDGVLTERDSIRHHLTLEPAVRQGFYNRIFLGTSYLWRRELENPFALLTSKFSGDISIHPIRGLTLSTKSGYDFRDGVKEPVEPFLSSLEYRSRKVRYHFLHRYNYHSKSSLDWLAEINLRNISETRLRYNHLYPNRLELSEHLDFRLGNFRIQPGARTRFEKKGGNYSFSKFIESSLTVTWDMHCWQTHFRLVKRGKEAEFWVLANISAFPDTRVGVYGNLINDADGIYSDFKFHRE